MNELFFTNSCTGDMFIIVCS